MKKEITILIPTFNRSSLLVRALDSLCAQDSTISINCIVSDNCSNDDTEDLLSIYKKNQENLNIRYIRQEKALTPLDNWKFLLSYMDTEYSKFLFDDDWLEESALSVMFSDLNKLEADSLVYNTNIFANNNNYEPLFDYYKHKDTLLSSEYVIDSVLRIKNVLPVSPSATIMKSSTLSDALLFSEINKTCSESVIGNDLMMNFYSVFNNEKTFFINNNIINLWGGDDSITMKNSNDKYFSFCYIKSLIYLIEKFDTATTHQQTKLINHKIAANNLRSYINNDCQKFSESVRFNSRLSVKEIEKYIYKILKTI